MKKYLYVFVAVAAALGMMSHGAEAAKKKKAAPQVVVTPWQAFWTGQWTVRDPKLAVSNAVVGGAATGGYFALKDNNGIASGGAYALSTAGCIVVSPMVGSAVVGRELSLREVWVGTGNCLVPFVGGWIANAYFDRHPEWDLPPGKRR